FCVTRRDLSAADAFSYESFVMTTSRPTRLRAVYYLGDPAAIRYEVTGAVKLEKLSHGLLWSAENPPVFPWEPFQAPAAHFAPTLHLAAATDDWLTLGRDYARELEPKLRDDPSVKALAQRLT